MFEFLTSSDVVFIIRTPSITQLKKPELALAAIQALIHSLGKRGEVLPTNIFDNCVVDFHKAGHNSMANQQSKKLSTTIV